MACRNKLWMRNLIPGTYDLQFCTLRSEAGGSLYGSSMMSMEVGESQWQSVAVYIGALSSRWIPIQVEGSPLRVDVGASGSK